MRNGSTSALRPARHVGTLPSLTPAHGRFLAAAIAAVFSLAAAATCLLSDDEAREIRALPVDQRQALYHRTLENLKAICDPAPGRSVREFCRRQAELAVKFRECDDECHRISRRHLSLPRP